MKFLKLVSLVFGLYFFTACDKDQDDITKSLAESRELKEIMLKGEWKITSYKVEGENKTAQFSDYTFIFASNNELIARSAPNDIIGSWRVGNDAGSETDSYNDVDFNIFFGASGKLAELTRNYDVISASQSEVQLSLEVDTNATILLTFSQP